MDIRIYIDPTEFTSEYENEVFYEGFIIEPVKGSKTMFKKTWFIQYADDIELAYRPCPVIQPLNEIMSEVAKRGYIEPDTIRIVSGSISHGLTGYGFTELFDNEGIIYTFSNNSRTCGYCFLESDRFQTLKNKCTEYGTFIIDNNAHWERLS